MSDAPQSEEPVAQAPQLSQFIGLVIGTSTHRVYAVLNPDQDNELDNPRHLLIQNDQKEPVQMAKVDRGAYMACMSTGDVFTLVEQWYHEQAIRIMSEPPYDGPTYIDGAV